MVNYEIVEDYDLRKLTPKTKRILNRLISSTFLFLLFIEFLQYEGITFKQFLFKELTSSEDKDVIDDTVFFEILKEKGLMKSENKR